MATSHRHCSSIARQDETRSYVPEHFLTPVDLPEHLVHARDDFDERRTRARGDVLLSSRPGERYVRLHALRS
jgi:hypothetical protein